MDDARTLWVGNIPDQATEELLYELFLQAGPLERVKIPTDRDGRKSTFGFITFKHEVSVPYTVQLFNGTKLYDKTLNIKPRNGGTQKDKQSSLQNPVQRSFSYPNEVYNLPQQNTHLRFDERSIMGPQHVSYEDLLRLGQMVNIGYNYPAGSNFAAGNNSGHNRHQNERSNFRDRDNRERDRKEFDHPRKEYDRDRDRRNEFSNNRNNRRHNQDQRNNYDRNGGRRNQRYY